MSKLSKTHIIIIVVSLVLVLAIGGFITYKYVTSSKDDSSVLGSTNPTDQDAQSLVTQISKLIELPQEEDPTVATITDITKLAGQDFFKPAQNGDRVLIYTQAKKAYLYRPSLNKIIDVAPVNINASPSAEPITTATVTPTAPPSPTP